MDYTSLLPAVDLSNLDYFQQVLHITYFFNAAIIGLVSAIPTLCWTVVAACKPRLRTNFWSWTPLYVYVTGGSMALWVYLTGVDTSVKFKLELQILLLATYCALLLAACAKTIDRLCCKAKRRRGRHGGSCGNADTENNPTDGKYISDKEATLYRPPAYDTVVQTNGAVHTGSPVVTAPPLMTTEDGLPIYSNFIEESEKKRGKPV